MWLQKIRNRNSYLHNTSTINSTIPNKPNTKEATAKDTNSGRKSLTRKSESRKNYIKQQQQKQHKINKAGILIIT